MLKNRCAPLQESWKLLVLTVGVLMFGLLLSPAGAKETGGGFTTVFSSPPFQEGETVLGIDGWEGVANAAKKPETATAEPLTNGDGRTGLLLRSYGIDKTFAEQLADPVRVSAVFNFSETGPGKLMIMPILGGRIDIVQFGYLAEANEQDPEKSGIVYVAQPIDDDSGPPSPHVLVPASDLVVGQPYTVTVDISFEEQRFSISVTGKKAGGTALKASATDISFLGKWNPRWLSGARIVGMGGPTSARILLESISVKRISQ